MTRETDTEEQETLRGICKAAGGNVGKAAFQDVSLGEAALLPGAEESQGRVQRFQIAPRLTSHLRHRSKYLDMPLPEPHAFVFTHHGPQQARSLKDFVGLLAQLPDNDITPYLRRHDFSRWPEDVFRDCPLATHLQSIENRVGTDRPRDLANDISQVVRARYEMNPLTSIFTDSG